jgi:hypothetical protein
MSRDRPLATIAGYADHGALKADVAVLLDAGVEFVVTPPTDARAGWRLDVDRRHLPTALEVLGRDEAAEAGAADDVCPRCGAGRPIALPPSLLIAVVVSLVLAGLLLNVRRLWAAASAVGAGAYVLRRVQQAPQWQCRNCAYRWNDALERDRQASTRTSGLD